MRSLSAPWDFLLYSLTFWISLVETTRQALLLINKLLGLNGAVRKVTGKKISWLLSGFVIRMFCFSLTVGNCYTHKRSIIQCVLLLVTTSFLIKQNLETCYCIKAKENCHVTMDLIIIVITVKLHSPAVESMTFTSIQTLGTPTWHADPFMTWILDNLWLPKIMG